jgi:hypothetical protein
MNHRIATLEAWKPVQAHVEKMRSGNQDITFAVRSSDTIVGFAGAAGHREGRVCCLNNPEEGNQLQPGEILVVVTTNIGLTPLFPRTAAIILSLLQPLHQPALDHFDQQSVRDDHRSQEEEVQGRQWRKAKRYGQRREREQHTEGDNQQDRDGQWQAGPAVQGISRRANDEEYQRLRRQRFHEPAHVEERLRGIEHLEHDEESQKTEDRAHRAEVSELRPQRLISTLQLVSVRSARRRDCHHECL